MNTVDIPRNWILKFGEYSINPEPLLYFYLFVRNCFSCLLYRKSFRQNIDIIVINLCVICQIINYRHLHSNSCFHFLRQYTDMYYSLDTLNGNMI